jgi:conjugal transfer/type IV secretion protein DotA/TraY
MRCSWPGFLILILLLLYAALPAHAQNAPANAFIPNWSTLSPGNDWSATIINNLFPVSANTGSSQIQSENTVIGQMLGQFTGFIMALAAAWVSYATIIQIHRAAETGRILSNTTSSWAPVRLFLAIIMMFPLSTGFSAGQAAVIQVAMWGIGMAKTLYSNAVQSIGPDAMPIATPIIPGTRGVVAGLMQSEICRNLVNLASDDQNLVPEPTPTMGGTPGSGGYVTWAYTLATGDATGQPLCGSITIREPGQPPNMAGVNIDMAQQQETALTTVLASDIAPVAQSAAQNLWQTRQASALAPLQNAYTTAVQDYTNKLTADASQAGQELQAAFEAAQARNGNVDLQQGQNQLNDLGWTAAGAYYLEIADLDGRTLSLLTATPTINPPSYTGLGPSLSSDLAPLIASVLDFQSQLSTYIQTADGLSAPGGGSDIVTGASQNHDDPSLLEKVLRKLNLAEPAVQALVQAISPTSGQWTDPFTALIHLGHVLITIALTAITLAAVLASATGTAATTAWNILTFNWGAAAASVGAHLLMTFLGVPIFWGCLALLIPGLLLAFILPMVPFAMWIAGVGGWLVLVFETIVAVPLWAFAHLTFQGDGLHGRGTEGYSLLLNVLVRPSLMLIGLFLGYYLFTCLSWLIFQSFGIAVHFVLADGWVVTNLLGAVVMICIFVLLHIGIALLSFRLISLFPHHVIKMIGFATPANRVDMDEFAVRATTVGMGAALTRIEGGAKEVLAYARNGGQRGPNRIIGGPGGGGAAPRQIGSDSTADAASASAGLAPGKEEG